MGDTTSTPAAAAVELGPALGLSSDAKNFVEDGRLLAADHVLGAGGANTYFGRGARRTDNGRAMTILLMVNYKIGSGILNAPQAVRESGLAASILLYVVVGEGTVVLGSI